GVEKKAEQPWVLLMAAEKPFVSIVWIATFMLMAGCSVAVFRHWVRERKKSRDNRYVVIMPRYKLTIEYKGTNYSSWQNKTDARIIEEEIEKSFDRVHDQHISMYGQGRTDGGVDAIGQTAHFDIPKPIDIDKLKHAFLGVLPSDIAVWDIREVEEDFYARFDAIYRQYIYRIARRPRPLFKSTSILAMYELDMARMRECAKW